MKHLYFVRHGLSEANKAGVYSGQSETPLSPEGRLQAKLAGEYAKSLHVDHIVSSTFSRAHDTAHIIAHAIGYPADEIELNSLFVERGMGVLEGQVWDPDLDADGFADVETTDTLLERMRLAYRHLLTIQADNILVVSHGATGRALRHVIYPDTPFKGSERFPNAEIVQLI